MSKQKLVCPHCGERNLYSTETTTIDYPVRMWIEDGAVKYDYTGGDRSVDDEGTCYEGRICCQSCGSSFPEADLVTAARYAHDQPNVISVDEQTDRGRDPAWKAFCSASIASYSCEWAGEWHHADSYVEEAQRRFGKHAMTDPMQLAYEAAEAEGRQHLRQYLGEADQPVTPPLEDGDYGPAPHPEQAPLPADALPG